MYRELSESTLGAHHCTRENLAYTIQWLKEIEQGNESVDNQDWRTTCGVIALQLQWLISQADDS